MKKDLLKVAIAIGLIAALAGCARFSALRQSLEGSHERRQSTDEPGRRAPATAVPLERTLQLEEIATSDQLWTGVAVSKDARIFVSFPRRAGEVAVCVGEIRAGGKVWPIPDADWNMWSPPLDPASHFICVQSLCVDGNNALWALDAGDAYVTGAVPSGAKLVKIDLRRSLVAQVMTFDAAVAPQGSYLSDLRIDDGKNVAYVTDSGLGALVVVDLASGKSRRLLASDPTTKSEGAALTIGGKTWRTDKFASGSHADALALDGKGEYLYYHALAARSLYRIKTSLLLDPALGDRQLMAGVELLGTVGAVGGMEFGPDGYLYLSGIEDGTIKVFASLGTSKTVAKDARLIWPSRLARGRDGYMYVTTSESHADAGQPGSFRLFRFKVE
jgi:sugar lactone lactonase YvrE